MINGIYTKETFKDLPEDFRIGAVASDGMWYSLPKWRKYARVSEEKLQAWVDEALASGLVVQAPGGARSYRFPLTSIKKWYRDNNLDLNVQLMNFLYPPRIWDNKSEVEGFLEAPLRDIGTLAFACERPEADVITEALRGLARVREVSPGSFKAYCLDPRLAKTVALKALQKEGMDVGMRANVSIRRRELVDFTPEFARGLIEFYRRFGRTLLKRSMETIKIFLPDTEDQDAQILMWVLEAIEKCDESRSVPFSAYLNGAIMMRPYDLPNNELGKDLSAFQRTRAKALTALAQGKDRSEITHDELAEAMGYEKHLFEALEERHRFWLSAKHATSLTWTEGNEEKAGFSLTTRERRSPLAAEEDLTLASKISTGIIVAALESECFDDAFTLMDQIDASELDVARIRSSSPAFIQALGSHLGIEGL